MNRLLTRHILSDLDKKMVFLGGPRQVGKTFLSLSILGASSEDHPAYLSWDAPSDRKMLLNGVLPSGQPLVVLDEVHKFRQWRNLIKGLYDKNKSRVKFLITGSARLDYYRRGGDSLQGRYHYLRLHPLSFYEMQQVLTDSARTLGDLMHFGGFPEPLIARDDVLWRRWQNERQSRILRDDLVSLESVRDLSQVETLAELLKERVGSVLSINSLREDLHCSHDAVSKWIDILENLYFCFRIAPYGGPKLKALKKEKKLFLWDWSLVPLRRGSGDQGARFENLVASQLLKYCHFREDTLGYKMELRYFRDKERREVDFVVMQEGAAAFAVECKTGDHAIAKSILYLAERTEIPHFYQVHLGESDFEAEGGRVRVLPFTSFSQQIMQV